MGMASSQARLLSLTARMHDIEYKAQKLEAQKLQMANKSTQVYNEYEEALNKTKLQQKTIGSDGSAYYVDATVKTMTMGVPGVTSSRYVIHNIFNNEMYCSAEEITKFYQAQVASVDDNSVVPTYKKNASNQLLDVKGNVVMQADGTTPATAIAQVPAEKVSQVAIESVTGTATADKAAKAFAIAMGDPLGANVSYLTLYKEMSECKLVDVSAAENEQADAFTNEQYLRNMNDAGFIVFHKLNGDNITGSADEVNVATDTALQEVADEVDLKKAEAKYEADMAKINAKDKKFDTDLAALEQERNAIKTEMDTLKTVAKDNVERTFKLFS